MELLFTLLVILIAGGVGYYFLVRWGRGKVLGEVRVLSGELRGFENQYRQALTALQDFSADDPAPYGELAGRLMRSADQVGRDLFALRERYVGIQQGLPHKAANPVQSVAVSPFKLFALNRETGEVRRGLAAQQAALSQIGEQAQEFERLGWLEALQIRQASEALGILQQRQQRLRDRHAHGSAFDELGGLIARVEAIIDAVPELFLGGDQDAVLAGSDKAGVIAVHQAVEASRALIGEADKQLGDWEKGVASLDERLRRLRQGVDSLAVTLESLPAAVDGAAMLSRYAGTQAELGRLQGQAARPELEKVAAVDSAIDQQIQLVQELDGAARRARQGQAALEHVLAELSEEQQQITDQYSALGTAKSFRVTWSRSSNTLAGLSGQLSQLGPAQRKRTPEKLEQDLEAANQLSLSQKELAVYLKQVADQHAELTGLLEGSELSQALLWVQNSNKLLGQMRAFHGDNWPRADGINTLGDDLNDLAVGLQRLGASRPADGIPEEQLAVRLENARRMGGLYQALRVRANAAEARLGGLLQSETQARETLESTRKDLAQIGFIVSSNPFLTKIAGQETGRFQKQIDKQLAELDLRQQGTVDSKERQASGLAGRVESAANGWLEQLNQDTQLKIKALTAALTRLDSIARLEDQPAVEARRLLGSGFPYGSGASGQKPQFALESLVLEFKRRSEYAQQCAAALLALQDLEKPVVDSFATASQNRKQVQDQFNTANQWARQARAWPPVAVDVEAEYQALGRLEADWAALREKPVKAIELVKRLGDLAREYQGLASRLAGLIERGNREQKDISKLEGELNEFLSRWEKLLAVHQDSVEASEDIGGLLNESDQEMYRVKSQYRDGLMDYDAVLQAIQSLHRKVRLFQAVLDDAHVVDVSGKVIASKDSRRAPGDW